MQKSIKGCSNCTSWSVCNKKYGVREDELCEEFKWRIPENEPVRWEQLPEWEVSKLHDDMYAIRIGTSINKPKKNCIYEDVNIKIIQLINGKLILGYLIYLKRKDKFRLLHERWWLSLLSDVDRHYNQQVIYNDKQIYVYKFNNKKRPSYWIIARNRPDMTKMNE